MPCVDEQDGEAARFQQLEQRNPVHAGGFHGDRVDAAGFEPVGQGVEVDREAPKLSGGSSSRSGGTATKWEALPMSMPAAWGWVIVRAGDLPGLRGMRRLRCAMACSIIIGWNEGLHRGRRL